MIASRSSAYAGELIVSLDVPNVYAFFFLSVTILVEVSRIS